MRIAVHTSGDVAETRRNLERVIGELEPGAAVVEPATMDELLTQSVSVFMRRFPLVLIGSFAATTLLLALIGIYGVVSYSVTNRTREMGIRMALGAQGRSVVRLILRDAAWLACAGVALGLAASAMLGRFVSAMLYGVSAHDPLTFAFVALVLGTTAIAATLPAARRATRVDPAIALRAE
jgi:ABC-type antimicrobial peptide transport system permease subunit